MTWPMHDAGPTTPDPGRDEPRREDPRRQDPDDQDERPDGDERPRRGRHAAAPDPLPPMEGPMPGGGPAPAETTLPLALSWPAPPPRTPRFTPSDPADPPGPAGSVGAPPGWRRVGSGVRPAVDPSPGHAPPRAPRPGPPDPGRSEPGVPRPGPAPLRAPQPGRPQPSFHPFDQPGRPGPWSWTPGPRTRGQDPAAAALRRRAGVRPVPTRRRPEPSVPAWSGPGPAWPSAPWSPGAPGSCAPWS